MKNILLATLEYPPDHGGVAEYLRGLVEALPIDVVLAPRRQGLPADAASGPKTYRRSLVWGWRWLPLRWLPSIFSLFNVVRRERIEAVIISHLLPLGYAAWLLKIFRRRPYVVIVHGTDLKHARRSAWKRFWAKRVLGSAAIVVANSEYTRRLVFDFGSQVDKTIVIYPCPSRLMIKAAMDRKPVPDRGGKKMLLSIARLVPRKGIDRVIRALPRLRELYGDVEYRIIGAGPDEGRLQSLVRGLGLEKAVIFAGALEDPALHDAYRSADVFVLPGREDGHDVEGFGIVFLEAALFGLPSVAGRAGGAPEAVIDGTTGLVVDPNSEKDIFEAISRLLAKPDEARRFGEAGRGVVLERYNWKVQARKLAERLV